MKETQKEKIRGQAQEQAGNGVFQIKCTVFQKQEAKQSKNRVV